MRDRANNPSNYAMVTVSEGATMLEGDMHLSGEEDAYGHRKLGGIGQQVGAALKDITGVPIIAQTLGYLMRSGNPDSLDLMVAINYAVMAADLAVEGARGRMVALRIGHLHRRPHQRHPRGRQARRRRRPVRRRRLPAQGPPGHGQAHVPVLTRRRWASGGSVGGRVGRCVGPTVTARARPHRAPRRRPRCPHAAHRHRRRRGRRHRPAGSPGAGPRPGPRPAAQDRRRGDHRPRRACRGQPRLVAGRHDLGHGGAGRRARRRGRPAPRCR